MTNTDIQEYSGIPDLNMVCVHKKKRRKSSIGWKNNAWYDVNMTRVPLFIPVKPQKQLCLSYIFKKGK